MADYNSKYPLGSVGGSVTRDLATMGYVKNGDVYRYVRKGTLLAGAAGIPIVIYLPKPLSVGCSGINTIKTTSYNYTDNTYGTNLFTQGFGTLANGSISLGACTAVYSAGASIDTLTITGSAESSSSPANLSYTLTAPAGKNIVYFMEVEMNFVSVTELPGTSL